MTDAVSENMGDEQFIANVSAGLALYGVVVGRDSQKPEKPIRQVLRMPVDCKLKAPSQDYIIRSGLATDLSLSDRFFETVSESGWSFALKLAGPGGLGFLAGGEIGAHGAAQKLSKPGGLITESEKEVWKMECHYVLQASFRIHNSQMCLSEEALKDVRRLRTLGQAKAFLHTYGSHVPDCEYHVGGMLLHGAGVKSISSFELSTLIESESRQLPGFTAGIFMSEVGEAKASVSAEELQTRTTWRKDESSAMFMKSYVRALGPCTAAADEFVQKLASNRSTWFIIDINEDAVLHPIWEVVGREAKGNDLRRQIKLLYAAWQISHSLGLYRDPMISPELLDELKCMKKEQLLQQMQCCVLAELYRDEASVPEAQSLQPLDTATKLHKIHHSATSNDAFEKVEHNVGALLFKVPAFEELMTYVAQSTVKEMNRAQRVLSTILNTDLLKALKEEGITLSRPILEMLELQDKHEELAPLEVPGPPAELPRMLKSILESFLSSAEDTSHHAPFSEAVEKVIKACIKEYHCEKVRKVVRDFGFDEDGILTGKSLTKENVKSMIEDLVESPQQPYQPVPLPSSGIKHTVAPYLWPSKSCYSYNGEIVLDRPLERDDVQEKMIDCIRHRVDPFSPPVIEVQGAFDFSDNWGEDNVGIGGGGVGSDTSQSGGHNNIVEGNSVISSPFLLLVKIMRKSDLTFQMALSKLLLEQRISVPLVLPGSGSRLGHILESLRYVEVKTANQKMVSIYDDNALPRVIFASRRREVRLRETATMASEVLGCHFVSQYCNGELESGPVLELGVGFYPDTQPGQHLPCLAFCIWGDLQQLTKIVTQIGDIIVLECDNDNQKVPIEGLGSTKHLYWETNSSRNGLDKKNPALWGSFKYVATGIRQYLKLQCAHVIRSSREALQLEECLRLIDSLHPVKHSRIIDKNFSSTTLMKSELQLQKSYAREAKFQFEAARIRNDLLQLRAKKKACQEEKRKRQQLCAQISNLPVLKLFVDLLSDVDPVSRRLSIVQMQRYFDQQNRMNFETAAENVDKVFEIFQNAPADSVGCQMLHEAKLQNVARMLGMEHLWRELCHIFIADPQKTNIPTLAAHHLLDGFPLEILDGEAGMYCKPWIDRVMLSLNNILTQHLGREPRIFVMSVVGLQSSGKSTLLNSMFGTQLQTSAGRCTRGVYLQLVRSDRTEFDYVVLLDIEGIRAPEFFGLEGSEAHDNRLATFAVLPADACVVVVSNEDDSGLKEVLSMVMLAYKGSAMTMNSGGWMPSKLFFVYRSIDTNDSDQLRSNQLKLQEHLQRAAFEAAGTKRVGGTGEERNVESVTRSKTHEQITADDLINSVINFRVHQDADKSDVKYLGNLKKENMPPGDIPDWAYGTKVMQIREYIHKRVTEGGAWHSHTLTDWSGYLGMVWKCIATADFELSFKSLVEFSAYEELTNTLEGHRRAVTKKYDEEFEIFERNLHNQSCILEDSNVLTTTMFNNVKETIKKQTVKVGVILSNPRWQKWKIQETDHWREYRHEICFHWSRRCKGSAGVLEFENVVRHYYRKLQLNIKELFKHKKIVMNREHPKLFQQEVDNHFENLFQRILQEVREKHKPLADEVPKWLTRVYARSRVLRLYNFQADEWSIIQLDMGLSSASYAGLLASKKVDAKGGPRLDLQDEGLQKMVDRCLVDAIKYSDRIVEEVIRETTSLLSARVQQNPLGFWGNKNNRQSAHIRVKRYLTDRLCAIQHRWDVEHNVARKLEQEKVRLQRFFVDCANEVGGSEMLAHEILDVLNPGRKSEKPINILIEAFKPVLIKEISGTLETREWLSNAKVFRALLDLHLLNMAEGGSNKEAELLQWTANGSKHYEFIMNTLLERELIKFWKSDEPWESFLRKVKSALNHAAVAAETAYVNSGLTETGFKISGLEPSRSRRAGLEHSGLKLFLGTLHDQLHSTVSKELASAISSLSADVYDYCNLDYKTIDTTISASMDDAEFKPCLDDTFKKEIIEGVRDKLVGWSKSGSQPRCQEACPKCHLTCYKAIGHSDLHDALHQPKGLVGIMLKSKKYSEFNDQLSCTSCSRAVSESMRWEKS